MDFKEGQPRFMPNEADYLEQTLRSRTDAVSAWLLIRYGLEQWAQLRQDPMPGLPRPVRTNPQFQYAYRVRTAIDRWQKEGSPAAGRDMIAVPLGNEQLAEVRRNLHETIAGHRARATEHDAELILAMAEFPRDGSNVAATPLEEEAAFGYQQVLEGEMQVERQRLMIANELAAVIDNHLSASAE